MNNIQLYLLILYLSIISCEKKNDNKLLEEADFVTYYKSLKMQINGIGIPSVGRVVIVNQELMMFSDIKSNKLNIFTNEGEFVLEIGKNGRGPGEFTKLSSYGFVDNKIVLFDAANDAMKYYDLNGKLLFEKNDIRGKTHSNMSRIIHDSKYGALMVMIEHEKKPYNMHESAVLFSVDDKSVNFAKFPKEIVFLGFRDVFPFALIDDSYAYIMYGELGLIEKWELENNKLVASRNIENGFNADNERFTLDSYLDEDAYLKKRHEYSIISHVLQTPKKLYILVYENINLDKNSRKTNSLDIILYEFNKYDLKYNRKIKLKHSIAAIFEDKVFSIYYDNKNDDYVYNIGLLN